MHSPRQPPQAAALAITPAFIASIKSISVRPQVHPHRRIPDCKTIYTAYRILQDGRFVNRPYDLRRFSTVGEGSPLPRFNKSKTVCIVIPTRSEGSADGFLHFLLSIIFYLFSII